MPRTDFGADRIVIDELNKSLKHIENLFDADCVAYVGPIVFSVDDAIRDAIEGINRKKGKLLFIIETEGGYAETARRISDTLRHHYSVVDFLVPSHAMSAGTILVMSGDAIHMDYYSVLGPIDPQVRNAEGRTIPALGYLIMYQKLIDKANAGKISSAEMQILLSFNQGDLYAFGQARDLSRSLLEEWLVKYKFKDWTQTETNGHAVTPQMKAARAKEIADKLNDVNRWNSHGIGINMDLLRKELNLKIDDFGADPELSKAVRRYHRLLADYGARVRHSSVIHTRLAYTPLMVG